MAAKKDADPNADVQRVAVVPDPNPTPVAVAAGPALTPGQTAGLDPIDPELDEEEAAKRDELTNRQTTHEADNALDPVSRSPSPGVAENAQLTAVAQGAPVTDMSGRPPMQVSDDVQKQVRDSLRTARTEDKDNERVKDDMKGYRTPQQLGIPRNTMEALIADGAPIEMQEVPGGQWFPETGRRYRLK